MDGINGKTEKLENDILNMTFTLKGIIKPAIAVKVRLSTNKNFAQGQRIIYDTVITNEGVAYNSKSGTFLVPVDGVYIFAVNTCSQGKSWDDVAIMKGGTEIARAVSMDYRCKCTSWV